MIKKSSKKKVTSKKNKEKDFSINYDAKDTFLLDQKGEQAIVTDTNIEKLEISNIPVIPIRDMVVFPNTISTIFVGKAHSINAIDYTINNKASNGMMAIVTEHDAQLDEIESNNIAIFATIATIMQIIKLPDGTMKLLIDAKNRIKINQISNNGDYLAAKATSYTISNINVLKHDILIIYVMRKILNSLKDYSSFKRRSNYNHLLKDLANLDNPDHFADLISSAIDFDLKNKRYLLEIVDVYQRLKYILELIETENAIMRLDKDLNDKTKENMDKNHREYFLNEQMKVIKKELGDDPLIDVYKKYEKTLKEKTIPKKVIEKIDDEIRKMKSMSNSSSEIAISRTYLDLLFDLPWDIKSPLNNNIKEAQTILDSSHYGMKKAKERIIESIAIQIKTGLTKKAILCLYGPPGVGKTSLAKAIAEATGRKFVKISLGGLRDEAEIRGHRKTYLGSMPGKIISAIKTAKVSNPIILLDEIDKLGFDHKGDPASALLEVLDPEQNKEFNDHYMEIEYDLSNIMFIATSNSLNIPRPLLDRMEIIKIHSYLEYEKQYIATNYIVPNKMLECGLNSNEFSITQGAIQDVIQYYTREAGVRDLARKIEMICRKTVLESFQKNSQKKTIITSKNLKKFLGIRKFTKTEVERPPMIGVVNGLAYTEVGGDVLLIEAVKIPSGKGEIKFTGTLGDVMKESVQTAFSFVKSNCNLFNIRIEDMLQHDIHIHAPDGATPKDGPSAGITLVTALVSLFTNRPVSNLIGMTGEITLRGSVTAIGGLREKLASAHRSGIKTVIIPRDNQKDVEELPEYIKENLEIKTFHSITDAISFIFDYKYTAQPVSTTQQSMTECS